MSLLLALLVSTATPSPETLVFYNARIASREGRHEDVLRLWLLRNALRARGETTTHDDDFRSLVWDSLAETGYCQDGFQEDVGGARLWPLALHNWLVRPSSSRDPPSQSPPFRSFTASYQQRFVSLHDVLDREELTNVRFFRNNCFLPWLKILETPTLHWPDLRDRLSVGIMMRDLIEMAQAGLDDDKVETKVVLETRLFDLEVALAKLATARVRRETGVWAEIARFTGLSEAATQIERERRLGLLRESEHTDLLRRCLGWDSRSWFALSQTRRLALFGEAMDAPEVDAAARDKTIVMMVDELISRQDGKELTNWLGFAARTESEVLFRSLTEGARGERLLGLEAEKTGFRERAAIALRRGTAALARGDELDAIRSFALAMQRSHESREADLVHGLARRWLAHVLAHYRADDAVIAILREFVPKVDRNALLEVLLWRAAFYADAESFERVATSAHTRGRLSLRVRQLRPLSRGDAGGMWNRLRDALIDKPHSIHIFARQFVGELSTENLDVRRKHTLTLELLRELLDELEPAANASLLKRLGQLDVEIQTLLDELGAFDESIEGKARASSPDYASYAGSLRLAPADPLPWPFAAPSVTAPDPFTPIQLTPIEWNDEDGNLVFGWRIHE